MHNKLIVAYHKLMGTETVLIHESLVRIDRMQYKKPRLDVPRILQEIGHLADLGANKYPKINAWLQVEGQISQIRDAVTAGLQISRGKDLAGLQRYRRLSEILGVEPAVRPSPRRPAEIKRRLPLRQKLGLTVAAALAVPVLAQAWPHSQPSRVPEAAAAAVERVVKPQTFAVIDSDKTTGVMVGEDQVEFGPHERVQVLRPAGNFRFLVKREDGSEVKIPMNMVELQGSEDLAWKDEVRPLAWLGFDSAQPDLIDKIPQLGAGAVRIPVEGGEGKFFREIPEAGEAIQRAKANNLKILINFNPRQLLPEKEIEIRVKRILDLLGGYQNVSFEIGNEPDASHFWEGASLEKYAEFYKRTDKVFKKLKANTSLVVGATVTQQSIPKLVRALRVAGLDTAKLKYAIHTHNYPEDIPLRIETLRDEAGGEVEVIVSEGGWNANEEQKGAKIVEMIRLARENGVSEFYIFQLRNISFPDENFEWFGEKGNWGVAKPDGTLEKSAYYIMDLTRDANNPQFKYD